MSITLPADLEAAVVGEAQRLGTTPELVVAHAIRESLNKTPSPPQPFVPRDKWEQDLLDMAIPCGVSLSDEAVSSEGLYD